MRFGDEFVGVCVAGPDQGGCGDCVGLSVPCCLHETRGVGWRGRGVQWGDKRAGWVILRTH